MTSAGTNIEQRSVVLLPFPFTDLSSNKKRPVLVISNNGFNKNNDGVICCLITSNPNANGVKITSKDMESGFLEFESTIKPYRLFTANKSLIYKIIGKLNKEKSRSVVQEISAIVKM